MTRHIQPIGDLRLDCGRTLQGVEIAYEALGTLSRDRDNVIVVAHGFTSGPDMILSKGDALQAKVLTADVARGSPSTSRGCLN